MQQVRVVFSLVDPEIIQYIYIRRYNSSLVRSTNHVRVRSSILLKNSKQNKNETRRTSLLVYLSSFFVFFGRRKSSFAKLRGSAQTGPVYPKIQASFSFRFFWNAQSIPVFTDRAEWQLVPHLGTKPKVW